MALDSRSPMIDGLIFDMDGVIIDSEPMHLKAYIEAFGQVGVTFTSHDYANYLGINDADIVRDVIFRTGCKVSDRLVLELKESRFLKLMTGGAHPRPGLLDTLGAARGRGIRTAVASSAFLETIQLVVESLGIAHLFHALTSGEEVERGKPAPDIYLLAASRIGVHPSRCLVIEDTLNGIRGALAAGMKVVSIPCEVTRLEDHSIAHLRLESLSELSLDGW